MKKFIKTGLSAVAAFAFMFATSVTVVAQESSTVKTDADQLTTSVEATMLANTLQKLNASLLQKDSDPASFIETIGKETAVRDKAPILTQERWFLVDVSGADDPADPEEGEQILTQALAANAAKPCNESEIICAVKLIMPASTNPASLQNLTVEEARALTDVDLSPTEPDPYAYFNQ